ncbi:MAG: gamma-glutamyl-gamma-aminobutyrate hydrolase family protein [Ktedonobacteraceae bacterium]|nr:gamma-glutamyl-gamma-aminobutyrate hydrolase family protein [Ktedonobacteraceae bacterium]
MRPLIGVPCLAGFGGKSDSSIYYNNQTYIHAVERSGGMPVLIPILTHLDGLDTLLPRLDGLLLSGGIDLDPRCYHEEPHPLLGETNPHLDKLELTLARWALKYDVPTLGICRGMQVLNVVLGGTLYQDLSAEYSGSLRHTNWDLPRNKTVHQMRMKPGSLLEKVLGVSEIPVNSLHHQAVKKIGKGVLLSGYSEDGVPEGLEVPEHRFMLAVQCHPEEMYNDSAAWVRYFDAFVNACVKKVEEKRPAVAPLLSVANL